MVILLHLISSYRNQVESLPVLRRSMIFGTLEPVSHLGCDERNLKPGHQHYVDTPGGCWRLLDSHLFQSWRSLGPLVDIMTGLRLEM